MVYGMGVLNEVSTVVMLKAGLNDGSYGTATVPGVSFLFVRILEGSLVGTLDLGGSALTEVGIGVSTVLLNMETATPIDNFALSLLTDLVPGLIVDDTIVSICKFTINQSNSTFGTNVMVGAENSSGCFLGPLVIPSMCAASILVDIGTILGTLGFYAWREPTAGGAILGVVILGAVFLTVG